MTITCSSKNMIETGFVHYLQLDNFQKYDHGQEFIPSYKICWENFACLATIFKVESIVLDA